mgnify:CR=1 FL=1
MQTYEAILAVGGKSNSLGRASEVIEMVLANPASLDELFQCIFANDAWIRMRAIDSFEKICRLHPEWIEPYIDTMLSELTSSTQPSIQWHLAEIFAEVEMTRKQTNTAIAWLKERISSTDVDWIVSVNTMKALLEFESKGLVTAKELIALFTIQKQHASQSVRKKATVFAEKLQDK